MANKKLNNFLFFGSIVYFLIVAIVARFKCDFLLNFMVLIVKILLINKLYK